MVASRRPALDTVDYSDRPRVLPQPAVPDAAPVTASPQNVASRPPGRRGKRAVAFWLDPAAHKQLRSLALQRDTNLQALMEEAADDLFAKHGLHRIAGAATRG